MTKVRSNESRAFLISIVAQNSTENFSGINDVCCQSTTLTNKSNFWHMPFLVVKLN